MTFLTPEIVPQNISLLLKAFGRFGSQEATKKGGFLTSFEAFAGTLDFLFSITTTMKNKHFGRPEGLKLGAFSRYFLGVGFGRPLGKVFLDFDRLLFFQHFFFLSLITLEIAS